MTQQTETALVAGTEPALVPGAEFTAEFDVTGWDEQPYDEPAEGGTLARVTVRKAFRGAIEGTSVAELLTAANRGYVATERFTGSIGGRHGTVVFQHAGLDVEPPRTFGHVVPETGTGELTGLTGTIAYRHDESGHSVRLVLG